MADPTPIQSTVPKVPAAAAAPVAPAAPAAPDELAQTKAQLKAANDAVALAKRDDIVRRRQAEREKQSFGDKLKEADEYGRVKRTAKINPEAAAKMLWGDNWYDLMVSAKINGGVPTADVMADEIQKAEERGLNGAKALLEERDKKDAEAKTQAEAADKDRLLKDATFTAEHLSAEHPALSAFGGHAQVGQLLVNQFNPQMLARYRSALSMGDVDTCAAMLKNSANALEANIVGLAEKVAASPKYADKLRALLTPAKPGATVPPVVKASQSVSQGNPVSQPRRTLTNDLTGSTPPDAPKYRTDAQRQAAALAAYEASRSKQ